MLSLLLAICIFVFWYVFYPQALSYQEQNQLFLWSCDYFVEDVSKIGGLADYLGEFLVQFYYVEWLGALVIAIVYAIFHRVLSGIMHTSLALIPCVLLLWYMGDENVLMSFVVAIIIAAASYLLLRKTSIWLDIIVLPILYWLIGPIVWIYALLRLLYHDGKLKVNIRYMALVAYMAVMHIIAVVVLLNQWPMLSALFGTNYYRVPLEYPAMQFVIPAIVVLLPIVRIEKKWFSLVALLIACVLGFCADHYGYEKDKYELIYQDYLIRNGRWNDVIKRAEKYQVPVNFSSESVNLSLAMTGQLAARMFTFYQSGEDALIMPRMRDNTSNLPSMEAFYQLGMVNEAMRYAFDIQESILNGKKSGRMMKRIAECCIINGRYVTAEKYLNLLSQSLFYKEWAEKAKTYLGHEEWIDTHDQWGRIRRMRYKDDFLYSYPEKHKMFYILFNGNTDNKMALEYFLGQTLLNGDTKLFKEYLPLAERYGGYSAVPYGYQDAWQCIEAHGNLPGSSYANYVNRMMKTSKSNTDGVSGASMINH